MVRLQPDLVAEKVALPPYIEMFMYLPPPEVDQLALPEVKVQLHPLVFITTLLVTYLGIEFQVYNVLPFRVPLQSACMAKLFERVGV